MILGKQMTSENIFWYCILKIWVGVLLELGRFLGQFFTGFSTLFMCDSFQKCFWLRDKAVWLIGLELGGTGLSRSAQHPAAPSGFCYVLGLGPCVSVCACMCVACTECMCVECVCMYMCVWYMYTCVVSLWYVCVCVHVRVCVCLCVVYVKGTLGCESE